MSSAHPAVFVLSTNDDLLDQFREQINRNSEVSDDVFTLSSISSSSVHLIVPSATTVLLLGRTIGEEAQKLISNVLRLKFTWNAPSPLIIAKHELANGARGQIEELIKIGRREWSTTWNEELARLRTLRGCKALDDRRKLVEKWIIRSDMPIDIVIIDTAVIEKELSQRFHVTEPFRLSPALGPSVSLKPPALHWGCWPHDGELQVSVRAELSEGCLTEEFFRGMTEKVKNTFSWDYIYDWVSGVFVKQNEVKVVVSEVRKTIIEIAARVDIDELEEENDEAMRTVWSIFAPVIACFAQNAANIPHTMYLVLVGAPFFNKEVSQSARAFEITELLSALNIARNVVFRVGDESIRLQVDNVFPDRRPKTVADIWSTDIRIEIVASPTSPQKSFRIEENHSAVHDNSMFLSAMKSKQKGRRVSFGAIRLLPAFGDEQAPSTSLFMEHPIMEDHTVVSEYVDRLLNDIMEETISLR
uniref:Protein kinase domain-containing protein n=1 Tax=Steinernema glaseri TaxID=37863 RepID=A0A1I7ZAQ4_9BILA